MKKILLITLCLLCLAGCTKQKKIMTIGEYLGDGSQKITTDNMPISMFCSLGSGQTKTIDDVDAMYTIYAMLQEVKLNVNSTLDELHVDDGDICFFFALEDGSELKYSFITSEYFYDGSKYISVEDPSAVRDIMDVARNAEESKNEYGTNTQDTKDTKLHYLDSSYGSIEVTYIDNGDEAPNVVLLEPDWNFQQIYLDGVYSIEDYENNENGMTLTCKVGDYYSHDRIEKIQINISASGDLSLAND